MASLEQEVERSHLQYHPSKVQKIKDSLPKEIVDFYKDLQKDTYTNVFDKVQNNIKIKNEMKVKLQEQKKERMQHKLTFSE